jgi:hypothetical protein
MKHFRVLRKKFFIWGRGRYFAPYFIRFWQIFIIVITEYAYYNVLGNFELRESEANNFTVEAQKSSIHIVHVYCSIWVKSGKRHLHTVLLGIYEFREKECSEVGVNEVAFRRVP